MSIDFDKPIEVYTTDSNELVGSAVVLARNTQVIGQDSAPNIVLLTFKVSGSQLILCCSDEGYLSYSPNYTLKNKEEFETVYVNLYQGCQYDIVGCSYSTRAQADTCASIERLGEAIEIKIKKT